jgi:alpha-tubulin suppressor-like RCC1 family protein
VADGLGNPGPAADADATTTLTLDRVGPAVSAFSSAVASPTNTTSIGYTLTFSESITGLTSGDLSNAGTATGCAFAPSASAGTTFTITVTGCSATGTLQPRLVGGGVADSAGNAGPASAADATTTLTLDRVAPSVTAIGLQAASDSGVSSSDRRTKAATLIFDVTFSEIVSALTPGDLATSGTAAGCTVTDPAGFGPSWTVILTGCGEGTVTLRFLAGAASDVAGNAGPATDSAAATVTIDRTAPAVTIASASGSFMENPALSFTVTGSESLDCATLGAGDLAVTNGTLGAITDDGSGCAVAVMSGVAEGALGSTSLAAGGSFSVADEAGNAAGSASGSPSVTVDRRGPDTESPAVSGVDADPASAAPGATITVTATATDDRVITAAQARIAGGAWGPASAVDGTFDEASEAVTASLVLPAGDSVQVCVRATDGAEHTSDPACTTVQVSGAAGIAAGGTFTCVALADGSARCFGANGQGQLGDGLTAASALPVVVRTGPSTPLAGIVSVATGNLHACAVLSSGRVACWGDNAYGKLGDGTTTDRPFATLVPGLTGVTAVTAGTDHTCALRTDGTVRCWGRNGGGRLGDGTTTTRRTPVKVVGLSGVTAIAAGGQHTCARLSTGAARCWGVNADGQLGDGTKTARKTPVAVKSLSGVKAISAGTAHTCVRLGTSALRCFGDNSAGQLGDGTLVDRSTAVAVKTITTASGIAAGGRQSCAVLADGSARCWGLNASGQLGDGTTTTRNAPVTVAGLADRTVLSMATGAGHTCARLASGGVVCWGANAVGQLGDGTTTGRPTPNRVRKLAGDARGQAAVTVEPRPTATPKPGAGGPASTPEPTSEPTSEPEPTAEPTPAPRPEPTPEPVPTAEPEPEPEPEPSPEPQPAG